MEALDLLSFHNVKYVLYSIKILNKWNIETKNTW